VLKILDKYDAFLLANHGALTIGKEIYNAYYKMETLEHFAHIAFVAEQLGHMTVLNKDQVAKLTDLRQKFGIRTSVGCVSCEEDPTTCSVPAPEPPAGGQDTEALVRSITDAVMKKLQQGS
jgi:L-fuculose-phosphate aldolase